MQDFEYFEDHLKCNHCNEKVERGIINVSYHWLNCLKRSEGLVIAKKEREKQLLDRLSINKQ